MMTSLRVYPRAPGPHGACPRTPPRVRPRARPRACPREAGEAGEARATPVLRAGPAMGAKPAPVIFWGNLGLYTRKPRSLRPPRSARRTGWGRLAMTNLGFFQHPVKSENLSIIGHFLFSQLGPGKMTFVTYQAGLSYL
jgi:hypothetical protein